MVVVFKSLYWMEIKTEIAMGKVTRYLRFTLKCSRKTVYEGGAENKGSQGSKILFYQARRVGVHRGILSYSSLV